jgi:putative Holliday junction resolvase
MSEHHILLGFDFGLRDLGVAVGQTVTGNAKPLPTLRAQNGIPNWEQIAALISNWRVDGIIVGVPVNMDGTEQNTTFAARKFANRLRARFQLPVYQVDERLTTREAKSLFGEQETPNIKIDSYAAKLILESWLREQTK